MPAISTVNVASGSGSPAIPAMGRMKSHVGQKVALSLGHLPQRQEIYSAEFPRTPSRVCTFSHITFVVLTGRRT